MAKDYEVAIRDFEEQVGLELLDYVARGHQNAPRSSGDARNRDSLISELAAYAEVLHDALEHETHSDNRMHHLGHLAMAARMFTYLHFPSSGISLKRLYRIETCSHADKLPGDSAKAVRDAWSHFEPMLQSYVESEEDAGT